MSSDQFEHNERGNIGEDDKTSNPPYLSQDDLVSILQWLPVKKLIQLERVCRQWKEIVIPRSFGKANRKSFVMDDFVKGYKPWRSTDGSVDRLYIFDALLDRLGPNLTSFVLPCLWHVRDVSVSQLLQLLTAKCPNLKHLDISYNLLRSEWLSMLPTTLDSIRMDTYNPEPPVLHEFISTRPHLKKFWMSANCENPIRDVPKWLAQYCPELTNLSLFMYGGGQQYSSPMFDDVFPSLTHLKVLEVMMPNCFNSEDLEELCANCPDMEVLMLDKEETTKMTNVMPILQLKKLKRLDLRKFVLTDQSIAALCEGVGATLEFFQLSPNSLTDASLHAIGHHCHNLADLRFYFGGENKFTREGMESLIETIISSPGWNNSANNRQLSIAPPRIVSGKVNWAQYGARVVRKGFSIGTACFGAPGFHYTENSTLVNSHLIRLSTIDEHDLMR